MRKWISERVKRRKKAASNPVKETPKALEPLQPRFYDEPVAPSEPIAAETVVEEPAEVPAEDSIPQTRQPSQPELAAEAASTPFTTPAADARPRISRRRRGRGRRGGNRQQAAPPAVAVPSAPEPSAAADPAPVTMVAAEPPTDSPSAPATPLQAAAAPARANKGTVVLAIGLPGSGKSSWFKRHNIHPLSSDLLRELLFDDPQEQRFQDLVFSNLRSMLKARLIARRPMNYVDATNLTPHDRHSWIKLAKDYGYDVQGLFFDVPLEVCMERHERRGRVVAEDVMRRMASKLKPPTFEEGFSKITVVRVKQKQPATG